MTADDDTCAQYNRAVGLTRNTFGSVFIKIGLGETANVIGD